MQGHLKLIVSNGKKKEEPFLKGEDLRVKLSSIPSVYEREVFILDNLRKIGL